MEIRKPLIHQDFYDGVMTGQAAGSYQKHYRDVVQVFREEDPGLSPDTLMYQVYTFRGEDSPQVLLWGLTVLEPVLVAGECNMTRGHFHLDRTEPEIYFGCGGEGLLLLMDEDRKVWAEEVSPGSVHYIRGSWAHRLINTGSVPFKVGCCWKDRAGHDYAAIEKAPFPVRVYRREGRLEFV